MGEEDYRRRIARQEMLLIFDKLEPADLNDGDLEVYRDVARAMRRAGASRDGRPVSDDLTFLGDELDRRLDEHGP